MTDSGLNALIRVDPVTRQVRRFPLPSGRPNANLNTAAFDKAGALWFTGQAGVYGRLDPASGRIWVSEWNAGQVGVYEPSTGRWREWRLPGPRPQAYAVYVDEVDKVWLSDFGANALVRFDPAKEAFASVPLPSARGEVRQILGRPGEVWGAESAVDKLVVVRTA